MLDNVIAFFVGNSDNLDVFSLNVILQQQSVFAADQLAGKETVLDLQKAIGESGASRQMIRSQVIGPGDVPSADRLPELFQMFGQRFTVDSFVLSKVVYDETRLKRMRPTGLDVFAALGNPETITLLESELGEWQYSENLMAAHEFVAGLSDEFWSASLANSWLDSLRFLDVDVTKRQHAPTVMKTRNWQIKQLQTQLSSWAEQRHDTLLYAKQSYSVPGCAYPAGYVEPYPDFYHRLEKLSHTALVELAKIDFWKDHPQELANLEKMRERQRQLFQEWIKSMAMLRAISQKELNAEELSDAEEEFLRQTFDNRGTLKFGSSGVPNNDGWYCRLFYERHIDPAKWKAMKWEPTIADVHTDPQSGGVLEVGVGDVNLMVIAVDNEQDLAAYVGPVYSYYEFWSPVSDRLTDQQWQQRLASGAAPERPDWTKSIRTPGKPRQPTEIVKFTRVDGNSGRLMIKPAKGGAAAEVFPINERLIKLLGTQAGLHSIDLSNVPVEDKWLRHLSRLPDLRTLNLRGTRVTDAGLDYLTAHRFLQSLDLSSTSISDAGVQALKKMANLDELDVRDTKISEAALRQLQETLKNTRIEGP